MPVAEVAAPRPPAWTWTYGRRRPKVIAAVTVDKDYDLACYGINVSDSTVWRQLGFNFRSTSSSNRLGYRQPGDGLALDACSPHTDHEATVKAVADVCDARREAKDIPMAIIGATDEGIAVSVPA